VKEKDLLELMKEARAQSGLPLDFWVDLTEGLDYKAVAILCGRSAIFPKYINSSGKP
jgi:hypothetical protein